ASKKVTPIDDTTRPIGPIVWRERTAIVQGRPNELESAQKGAQDELYLKDRFNPESRLKLQRIPQPRRENITVSDYIEDQGSLWRKVAISSDGKSAAVPSCQLRKIPSTVYHRHENHHIVIFDLPSGKERLRFPVEGWHLKYVKFSPDGRRVASTSGRSAG